MNKITKLVLRLIKESKDYNFYINNKYFSRQFNNIAIPWVAYAFQENEFKRLYKLLEKKIDVIKYRDYTNFNHIIILNIKNAEKLFNYLNKNGIIWGGGNVCSMENIPKGFDPCDKYSYLKLYNDENRIYYGSSFDEKYFSSETVLTEKEFYVYYEEYKKRINDNFERFLKK